MARAALACAQPFWHERENLGKAYGQHSELIKTLSRTLHEARALTTRLFLISYGFQITSYSIAWFNSITDEALSRYQQLEGNKTILDLSQADGIFPGDLTEGSTVCSIS